MLHLSLFADVNDNEPKPLDLTWEEFVAKFNDETHRFVEVPEGISAEAEKKFYKSKQPLFCPTEFQPGGLRRLEYAVQVHLGVLDIDHQTDEKIAPLFAKIESENLECLVYTGWSHTSDHISLRIIIPFTRPIPAKDWPDFWLRMNHFFGGYLDVQCKDATHFYFMPTCPTSRKHEARIQYVPGNRLNVDDIYGLPVPASAFLIGSTTHVTKEDLQDLAKKLKRKNSPSGAALERALKGELWAENGQRNSTFLGIARDIMRAFPHAEPEHVARYFELACTHTNGEYAWDGIILRMLAKAQQHIAEEKAREENDRQREYMLSLKRAFNHQRAEPYTTEELELYASKAGCTPAEFMHRWILQHGGAYYYFVAGNYRGPISREAAKEAAHQFLAPAVPLGVQLETFNKTGDVAKKTISELVMQYGTVVEHVVLDMQAQTTHLETATGTLIVATCPQRKLEAKYDPVVKEWLRLLAGPLYPKLEEWISWLTSLEFPCVALFLEGRPGAGKSLLAKGLSRIWTENGPTMLDQVMGNFNAAFAKCPLALADEIMPKDMRGHGRTAELRLLIQQTLRPYKQKNLPDATLRGAGRIIIAANNRSILEDENNLTIDDIHAIIGRILHIEVSAEAAAFLKDVGWIDPDRIACHALWLMENIEKSKNPPRFLVESVPGRLHRTISSSSAAGSALAHWLVQFLLKPGVLRDTQRPFDSSAHWVRVDKGELCVNVNAPTDHWEVYPTRTDPKLAQLKYLSHALAGLSKDGRGRQITVNGQRKWFRVVRFEDLAEFASAMGLAEPDELRTAMEKVELLDQMKKGNLPPNAC